MVHFSEMVHLYHLYHLYHFLKKCFKWYRYRVPFLTVPISLKKWDHFLGYRQTIFSSILDGFRGDPVYIYHDIFSERWCVSHARVNVPPKQFQNALRTNERGVRARFARSVPTKALIIIIYL